MRATLPGLCDLQVNGFAGVDFNRPGPAARIEAALQRMAAGGVTRLLPTLISSSRERFAACVRPFLELSHPAVAGFHMEGPYLSSAEGPRGAHPLERLRPPSRDDFERRQEAAGGRIRLVTLAPELPGALELIALLVERGVRAAIGHTGASPDQIRLAVDAGATLSTHLGNGAAPARAREPNALWAQMAEDRLYASLICDGRHLTPEAIRVLVRAKGAGRIFLVSDATAAAGSAPGRYTLGEIEVERTPSGAVRRPGGSTPAGSALILADAVGRVAALTGLSLEQVGAMASTAPAGYLGLGPAGRIEVDWDPQTGRLEVLSVERELR